MTIEKLAAALKKEAALQEEAVAEKAEEEAARIVRDAEQKAEEMEREIQRLAEKLKEKEELLKSRRIRMIRRERITRLHSIYAEAVKSRCKELYGQFMQSGQYAKFVKKEFQKARAELGGTVEIRADAVTVKALKSVGGLHKAVTDDSVERGFVAASDGGRVSIISTFASRLERAWKDAAPQITKTVARKIEDEH